MKPEEAEEIWLNKNTVKIDNFVGTKPVNKINFQISSLVPPPAQSIKDKRVHSKMIADGES